MKEERHGRSIIFLACVIAIGIFLSTGVQAGPPDDDRTDNGQTGYGKYAPNVILVKFSTEIADVLEQKIDQHGYVPADASLSPSLDELNAKYKVRNIIPVIQRGRYALRNEIARTYKIEFDEGQSIDEAIAEYGQDTGTEYTEPDYIVSINTIPDDPLFDEQWSLDNTGQPYPGKSYPIRVRDDTTATGTPDCDIDASAAWDVSQGNGVIVAVVDTGVDYNHPDIAANMWSGRDGLYGYGNFVR